MVSIACAVRTHRHGEHGVRGMRGVRELPLWAGWYRSG